MEEEPSSVFSIPPHVRLHVIEFLIHSSTQLHLLPVVKYTALSLFCDRFFPSLHRNNRKTRLLQGNDSGSWLLQPLRESNLQLFALIAIWISSKMYDARPLSVKSLKSLGDSIINDQHFTTRDFAAAELIFMKVIRFEIGASNITFNILEELLTQFREIAKAGEILSINVCMDVMDLLYETEYTLILYSAPCSLAASILVNMACLFKRSKVSYTAFEECLQGPRSEERSPFIWQYPFHAMTHASMVQT